MGQIRILVVEDDPGEVSLCLRAVGRFNSTHDQVLRVDIARDFEDAKSKLDKSFDGALIDLRLEEEDDAGNRLIQMIEDQEMRVPVIILTGTPGRVQKELSYVEVHTRTAVGSSYDDIIARFKSIYDTGITKILGGRGQIESMLGDVFRHQIAPQIDQWEPYGAENSQRTENALLRHVMYHLVQLIDEKAESSFPEEFYLNPSLSRQIRTGTILEDEGRRRRCVVMSPDCDVIVRNGGRNTNRILVVEVVNPTELFAWYDREGFETLSNNKMGQLLNALKNNHSYYYHCLPESHDMPLGFLDFRRLKSLPDKYIDRKFGAAERIQIAPPFVKDIVSRFASYYARQGQPEIDFRAFLGR